jgi:hypothetical protein
VLIWKRYWRLAPDPHGRTKDSVSAYRCALEYGLSDVATHVSRPARKSHSLWRRVRCRLRPSRQTGSATLAAKPDPESTLSEAQLRHLPNLAEASHNNYVRLMVEPGWPIAVQGGDWAGCAEALLADGMPPLKEGAGIKASQQ